MSNINIDDTKPPANNGNSLLDSATTSVCVTSTSAGSATEATSAGATSTSAGSAASPGATASATDAISGSTTSTDDTSIAYTMNSINGMSDEDAKQFLKQQSIKILNSITDFATNAPDDDGALEDKDVSTELEASSAELAELNRVLAELDEDGSSDELMNKARDILSSLVDTNYTKYTKPFLGRFLCNKGHDELMGKQTGITGKSLTTLYDRFKV